MASAPPSSEPQAETPPEPEAPTASSSPEPSPEPRFFRWIRGLGLVRRTGWLGGVCAAVAERTRLDPILVRGIVVVLAVLGAPVVLAYAAAWFLLPDEKGAIHALTLARGRVEGAVVAIAALTVASFLPLTQGFWWVGAAYWGEPDFAASAGRILWTLLLIVVAVLVVVWLARRSGRPEVPTVPATTDDRPETIPRPAEASAFTAEPAAALPGGAPPTAPAAPAAGASDAELAAWKAQQEEWKRQRAAWVAGQRAEDRARRLAAQAAWAEQRKALLAERRRREPWVGGAVIGIVFGLALIVGAGVGITTALAVPRGAGGWPAGFAAAAAVFGLGLAVAGLARRRAGALAAFAVLALVGALVTVPAAADRQLVPWVGGYGLDTTRSGSYARVGGETSFFVATGGSAPGTVVDVWQRGSLMDVLVQDGAAVRIIATVHDGSVGRVGSSGDLELLTPDSSRGGVAHYDVVEGTGTPSVTLRLELYSGSIQISPDRSDAGSEPTPAPTVTSSATPSTAATEGATP